MNCVVPVSYRHAFCIISVVDIMVSKLVEVVEQHYKNSIGDVV